MTERDLGSLLERASEHLPEVDFAHGAWSAAVAERARRRRLAVGTVGRARGGRARRDGRPARRVDQTPARAGGLGHDAGERRDPVRRHGIRVDAVGGQGVPAARLRCRAAVGHRPRGAPRSSSRAITEPLTSVVAVYLRAEGAGYRPVLVQGGGKQFVADRLLLAPTHDAGGNRPRRWVRAPSGGGGRYVVFPQRDHVVRLDIQTGDTVSYPVPSSTWSGPGGRPTARRSWPGAAGHAWTIDPSKPGAGRPRPMPAATRGSSASRPTDTTPVKVVDDAVRRSSGRPATARPSRPRCSSCGVRPSAPRQWAATGAFFDQNVTSAGDPAGQRPDLPGAGGGRGRPRQGARAARTGEPRRADRPVQGVLHRPRLGRRQDRAVPVGRQPRPVDPGVERHDRRRSSRCPAS